MVRQWAHDGGPEKLAAVLRDPKMRERLRKEIAPRAGTWTDMLTNFEKARNHRFEGRSIAQVADMLDKDPVDAICDLLVDEELEVSYVSAGGNLATLPKFVSHPLSMVGFAREAASRVVFMDHGRIVEMNTPERFFSSPQEVRTKEFLAQVR